MAMLGSPVPGLARLLLALVALATPTSSLHGAWRPRAATASRPTRRLANIKSQLIIARLEGGQILRIDEYADSAAMAPLMG